MIEALRRFGWGTREFLWPKRCAGCGIRNTWLCEECSVQLPPWTPEWCEICGIPPANGACRCDELRPSIDAVRSIGWHEGWIRSGVRLLKYYDERARAVPLGQLMSKAIFDLPRPDLIVPVPLSSRRELRRGFNQSYELGASISHETGIPLNGGIVRRIVDTIPQVDLPRHRRHENVRNAFEVVDARAVEGVAVLLVDDVYTTGATSGEAASVLKLAGARRVDVVTIARAGEHHAG